MIEKPELTIKVGNEFKKTQLISGDIMYWSGAAVRLSRNGKQLHYNKDSHLLHLNNLWEVHHLAVLLAAACDFYFEEDLSSNKQFQFRFIGR